MTSAEAITIMSPTILSWGKSLGYWSDSRDLTQVLPSAVFTINAPVGSLAGSSRGRVEWS